MPFIVFFPFAYTTTINAHVRVSLIKDLMPPKVQLRFDIIGNLICFVICAMLTYWSWLRFVESFLIREEMLAAIRLPWWVGKMAMPLGLGMFTIRYFMQFLVQVYPQKEG
jgi:TRAP-type C4-dicarboxylate transport system permease small subunit